MKCMNLDHFIEQIPLFTGLVDTQIQLLGAIVEKRKYPRGKVIFTEGEAATGLYVLYTGRVKIYKLSSEGKEQILHIFGPGEPFGEVAVFAGIQFPAYAEALESSEALFFPRRKIVELITKDPSMAMNMLAMLSKRLRYFTQLVENLSLKEVPQRLAAYLLVLDSIKDKEDTVELDIAKGQLANLLGTIPETLSRILNKMSSQCYIEVEGRQIRLLDRKSLESISMGEKLLA
jgi:CRP/FNR family transcriptional regulator, dissimilatory nitrate respiration regulator